MSCESADSEGGAIFVVATGLPAPRLPFTWP